MQLIGSLVVLYAGFASSYWAHSFLARGLELERFGDVMVAMGAASILAGVLLVGGQGAARKFLPIYLRDQNYPLMNGFMGFYCAISVITALAAAGLVLVVTEFGYSSYRAEALFVLVMSPLIAVSTLLGSCMQSINYPIGAVFPYQVMRPLLLLAGVFLWIELAPFAITQNAFMVYAPAFAILVIVQFIWYATALPFAWRQQHFAVDWPSWRAVGLPLLYSGVLNTMLLRIDMLALHMFDDQPKAVGTFALLVLVASLIWVNNTAVSNVISSRIAPLEGDREGLQRLMRRSGIFLLCANAATALVLIVFARPILATIHPEIEDYWPWLIFLCVGATINATLELASPFVRFGGLHKQAAKWATPILGVNAAVTVAAALLAGLEGVLVSFVTMRFARSLVYVWLVVKHLDLRPWRLGAPASVPNPEQA